MSLLYTQPVLLLSFPPCADLNGDGRMIALTFTLAWDPVERRLVPEPRGKGRS